MMKFSASSPSVYHSVAALVSIPLLVRFLNSAVAPAWHGYGIAVALLLVGLAQTVLDQRGFYGCLRTGVRIKSTLISAIYRKALKISSEARAKYTTGELTNFLSVDVNRIMESFMFSFFAWVAFVQFGFALYLLWSQLGVSTLAGVGCLLLLLPFNAICMWWTQKFQVSEMQWKDKRMKCLGEVIGAIRVLKLYAWEKAFEKKISEIRKHEVKQILGVASGWAVGSVLWNLAPYLILLVTFTTYTRNVIFSGDVNKINIGELLNPERIFVSVSLFNLLRGPLVLLPWSMSVVIMAYVSIRRVCTLLLAPELDKKSVIRCELDRISDGTAVIEFKDASFSWSKSGPIVLKNINLRVPRGWLVAVVGNVGSGKSSLLSACLGDLVKRTGLVRLSGSVGYVPQTAWIQQMSLRANICFDIGPSNCQLATEQELWYRKVIDACALQTDIDQLPAGDMTEIGERGVNLSGGQKQRVSLARAVFQNCDTYLMDDPLSAVDAQVGRHLFEHVLGPRGLLHNKTRLLTTNSLHWLPEADWILVLSNDGRVKLSGTYQELINNPEYLEIIKAANSSTQKGKHHSGRSDDPPDISSLVNQSNNDAQLLPSDSEMPQPGSYDSSPNIETNLRQRPQSTVWSSNESMASLGKKTTEEKGNFVSNEEVLQGHVSWAAYGDYISARSTALTTLMLVIYFGFLCFRVFSSYWLRLFADDKEIMNAKEFLENTTQVNETVRLDRAKEIGHLTTYYIVGYALIGVAQTALLLTSIILNVCTRMRAAKVVHRKLLHSVLCTAMPFFDHTPLGRILNRFSNDVDNVDHEIPAAFLDAIASFGNVMLSLALIIIALKPPGMGLAIVGPLLIVCFAILLAYLPSSRQARRLESATRSPLLANFSETAASSLGVTVVRAFGRTNSFAKHLDRLVDQNAIYGLLRFTSNRWLDTMLNISSRIMVFVTALVIVWFRDRFTPGLAGLIISFTFETAGGFTWMAMQYSQLETSAVSLERIREYSCLKEETNWNEGPASPPPDEWPSPCCEVVFNKATVKYPALGKGSNKGGFQSNWDTVGSDSENPAQTVTALHSVDLALSGAPSKRRIGVVGRTGAGKSTLASSLFMLVDSTITEDDRSTLPKGLSGCGPITVDGINLTELGLQEIRSRFSIIPQEPVLFSGTLRFNLDPFGACSDTELWAALEVAHLASWAHSPAIGLDYECGENGCNLSAGQRQLVCLARVCLSSGGRVRLLILDEATAAMDPTTDRLVMQTVVGDYFRDATVIIIAHRLETVMDTDMIVLMDHGKVVETGSPTALLADPNSRFTDLHRAWR
ncbi:unnamed protein product [Calicophoron daubneyi]|uniref:Uncharacterized protein n=1 Tax=Calicophoron daubneyi TaxID=300641 RepID=A0AAV2TAW1_CALDB